MREQPSQGIALLVSRGIGANGNDKTVHTKCIWQENSSLSLLGMERSNLSLNEPLQINDLQ